MKETVEAGLKIKEGWQILQGDKAASLTQSTLCYNAMHGCFNINGVSCWLSMKQKTRSNCPKLCASQQSRWLLKHAAGKARMLVRNRINLRSACCCGNFQYLSKRLKVNFKHPAPCRGQNCCKQCIRQRHALWLEGA